MSNHNMVTAKVEGECWKMAILNVPRKAENKPKNMLQIYSKKII